VGGVSKNFHRGAELGTVSAPGERVRYILYPELSLSSEEGGRKKSSSSEKGGRGIRTNSLNTQREITKPFFRWRGFKK